MIFEFYVKLSAENLFPLHSTPLRTDATTLPSFSLSGAP